jgi:16S rRNA (uracil1498-N3)-methyltransferase
MVRLYIPPPLTSPFTLDKDQTHYLRTVLRLTLNDTLHVFNEQGEWQAKIINLTKNQAELSLEQQLKFSAPMVQVGLAFAPLKHDAQSFLIEKATELGATHLYPVITQRSNIHRLQRDKLIKNTIEASQQCERLALPEVFELQALPRFLQNFPGDTCLFVAKERDSAPPLAEVLKKKAPQTPCIFLIGPEGGFTPEEFSYLARYSFTQFISLGPRILRAETAALATLSCFQAIIGDWQPSKNLSNLA